MRLAREEPHEHARPPMTSVLHPRRRLALWCGVWLGWQLCSPLTPLCAEEPQSHETFQFRDLKRWDLNEFDAFRLAAFALSSDGKLLAHAGHAPFSSSLKPRDGRSRVTVVDLDDPSRTVHWTMKSPRVSALDVASGPKRLAVGFYSNSLSIYALGRPEPIAQFKLATSTERVRLSADGRFAAAFLDNDAEGTSRIEVYDCDAAKKVGEFAASNTIGNRGFCFRGPDDEIVAIDEKNQLVVYDVSEAKITIRSSALRGVEIATTQYCTVATSVDGRHLVVTDGRNRVLFCDLDRPDAKPETVSLPDEGSIGDFTLTKPMNRNIHAISVSNEGDVYVPSGDGVVLQVDAKTRKVVAIGVDRKAKNQTWAEVSDFAVSHDGRRVATVRGDYSRTLPRLQLWTIENGKLQVGGDVEPHVEGAVYMGTSGSVLTWGDGAPCLRVAESGRLYGQLGWTGETYPSSFTGGGFASNGATVALSLNDLYFWKSDAKAEWVRFVKSTDSLDGLSLSCLSIARTGNVMFTGDGTSPVETGKISVWDLDQLKPIHHFETELAHQVIAVDVSEDGTVGAAVARERDDDDRFTLWAWNLSTKVPIVKAMFYGDDIRVPASVALSRNGKRFALIGIDGELSLGTLSIAHQAGRVRDPDVSFTCVEWITDSTCVVGTCDGRIRLIDAASKKFGDELPVCAAGIKQFDVAPSGTELLVVGDDGVVHTIGIATAGKR